LLSGKDPEIIVDGMPGAHPGFARANVALAFDDKGNLYLALEASVNRVWRDRLWRIGNGRSPALEYRNP